MQSYPSYRYRENEQGQIESFRVENPEHEAAKCPAEEGWRHSPDKDALPSVDPATLKGLGASGSVEVFPSYRYRKHPDTGVLETQKVESADDEAEKCPSDEGWTDSPANLGAVQDAPAAPKKAPAPKPAPADPNAPSAPTSPDQDAQDAAAMHAMKAADIIAHVTAMQNTQDLIRANALEQRNPKMEGGRKAVLKAINARMNELLEQQKDGE